ncbi:MAG: hypothetical protein WKF58_12395 [Ilumatobacteraceae bacterium]
MLVATLLAAGCADDTTSSGSDTSTASTSLTSTTAAPTTTVAPARGVCEALRADDLVAWFGWPVRGDVRIDAPSRCRLSLRDRQRVTISSGTETDLAARFEEFTASGAPLSEFRPGRPATNVVSYGTGHTVAVATTPTSEIVVIDVRAPEGAVPSLPRAGTAEFLAERMSTVGIDERAATLAQLNGDVADACWNLSALAGGRAVVVELVPAGLDLRRGVRAREEITIGRGLIGTVSFGVTEADRCRGADDGQPLGTSSWPLIAGRARARVRPSASPDGCLDVTLELSGLVVERPDDGRVPLPDVEVRNRSFGSGILDGCVFPRQA